MPLAVAPDPLARDAARVIAAGAARAGIEIAPTEATGADGWTVTLAEGAIAPGTLAPLRLHDIAGHTATLAHEGTVATELENDGARLAERWWFT